MEEEVKEEIEKENVKNNSKGICLNAQFINTFMAIVAMFLFVLCKVLIQFGVTSNAFYGIMSIIIYGLSLGGLIWAYIRLKKTSLEFWLNVVVFGLAIWLL